MRKTTLLTITLCLLMALPVLAQDDGRLNSNYPVASAIVYCQENDTGFDILRLENGTGQLALSVSRSEIPAATGRNQLVASNEFADFYLMDSGNYRVEAPFSDSEKYVFEWEGGCIPGTGTSTIETGTAGLAIANSAFGVGTVVATEDLPVIGPSASVDGSAIDLNESGYVITNTDQGFVRTGGGAGYLPIAIIEGGVQLSVNGVNESETWFRTVTNTGFEGWISGQILILRGNLSDVPVIPVSEMGELAPATFVVSGVQEINSYPARAFNNYICDLAPGEYIVNGSNPDGDWLQIQGTCVDGTAVTGWVQEIVGLLRNPQGGLLLIIDPDEGMGPSGPQFVVLIQQPVYLQASADSTFVCTVFPNRYPVLEVSGNDAWFLIDANCTNGDSARAWIAADAGIYEVPVEDTSIVTGISGLVAPATPAIPNREPSMIVFRAANITLQPGSGIICPIPAGEFQVLRVTEDGRHVEIVGVCFDGSIVVGWVDESLGALRNPFDKPIEQVAS